MVNTIYTYNRHIKAQIEEYLFKGKIIIIYGPRQVGKTTLCKKIQVDYPDSTYLNCERPNINSLLRTQNPEQIKSFIGQKKIVIFDEAQRVLNIGTTLKLLFDTYPDLQIIATGSSSFELANRVVEPLTGRNIKFFLYPLSLGEITNQMEMWQADNLLNSFLRFGFYPDIVVSDEKDKITKLTNLAGDYLYQDVLQFEKLKKSDLLLKLLQALALQLGGEVSLRELSQLLNTSVVTIEKYINLLEKSFVIFRLRSFSRNLRNELNRSIKIYFYDLGIRNSLINNFNNLPLRNDVGALWENFCIVERMKFNQAKQRNVNAYFWRTYSQQEIDYLEESQGRLMAYEFKYSKNKAKKPKLFLEKYTNSQFSVVNRQNYWQFLV